MRPRGQTAGKPRAAQRDKTKRAMDEETTSLQSVWSQIRGEGGKGAELRSRDIESFLNAAGARVDKDGLNGFLQQEIGNSTTGNVTEVQFMKQANTYFDTREPSEECKEVWQLVGGSLTGGGTVQASQLSDALTRLNCNLSKKEAADLVAFVSYGNEQMNYDDFLRALFP